jgi:hypothetical protein
MALRTLKGHRMKRYRAILPHAVRNDWDSSDMRYLMKSGVPYEVSEEIADRFYPTASLVNPNLNNKNYTTNLAYFNLEDLTESFTKEERPEFFL